MDQPWCQVCPKDSRPISKPDTFLAITSNTRNDINIKIDLLTTIGNGSSLEYVIYLLTLGLGSRTRSAALWVLAVFLLGDVIATGATETSWQKGSHPRHQKIGAGFP
jgi:hypothetical protein